MSANLIALCGFVYLYVAIEQGVMREWALALMYFGYAIANVGAWKIATLGIKTLTQGTA